MKRVLSAVSAPLVGRLSAAEFGNFIAGYSGIAYGGRTGLSLVIAGGVMFDATAAFNDNATFSMDTDSLKDIHNGAVVANMQGNGLLAPLCGCTN